MNASDTARLRQARSYYISKINELALAQPTADCLTATCTNYNTCKLSFPTYELKQLFIEGKNSYNNCKTTTSCGCGK